MGALCICPQALHQEPEPPNHKCMYIPISLRAFAPLVSPPPGMSNPSLQGCRIWDLSMSTSHATRKLSSVPQWLISNPQLMLPAYPMCFHVNCDPCPSPQVPRGPCFPWSPLALPLLHGLVSTATQVLLLEAHETGGMQLCCYFQQCPFR